MGNNTVNLLSVSVTNPDSIIVEIIHYSSEVWVRETKLCMSSKQDGNIGRNILKEDFTLNHLALITPLSCQKILLLICFALEVVVTNDLYLLPQDILTMIGARYISHCCIFCSQL